MADINDLLFEIERRSIIFHRDTSMPDGSQLGYTGNPNYADPVNSNGQFLLYHSPAGTHYLDKSINPHILQFKADDAAGGIWLNLGDNTSSNVTSDILIRKYEVTAAFQENEIIDILSGNGNLFGTSIPTGDYLTAIKGSETEFNNSNDMQIRLNGVHMTKGDDVIQVNGTAFKFIHTLDVKDKFQIIINKN